MANSMYPTPCSPELTSFEQMWSSDIHKESLADLLIKQFENVDGYQDLIKEITLQQKALAKDTSFLQLLSTRIESVNDILRTLLVRDDKDSIKHYTEMRDVLKKRHEFFLQVVEQRIKSINFGLDTLDRIPSLKLKHI
jgi:hypothetical protein